MQPPRLPASHPDRILECEEAIEAGVVALIEAGTGAGYTATEVALAISSVADNLILAAAANADTDRQIAEALARLRR